MEMVVLELQEGFDCRTASVLQVTPCWKLTEIGQYQKRTQLSDAAIAGETVAWSLDMVLDGQVVELRNRIE